MADLAWSSLEICGRYFIAVWLWTFHLQKYSPWQKEELYLKKKKLSQLIRTLLIQLPTIVHSPQLVHSTWLLDSAPGFGLPESRFSYLPKALIRWGFLLFLSPRKRKSSLETVCFKMGQPRPLFHLFLSFHTENFSSQLDSNSDRRSKRQEHWPLRPSLETGCFKNISKSLADLLSSG